MSLEEYGWLRPKAHACEFGVGGFSKRTAMISDRCKCLALLYKNCKHLSSVLH